MFPKLIWRTADKALSHLFTSNDPPSNAEETLARNTILSMQDEIAALRLKLATTNYFWSHWHRWRITALEDRKATIIKIISPLRKLPTDVLQVIFIHTHQDPKTTSTLPWSLSQVCRSWRMIVHATPALWSHITIDIERVPAVRVRSHEDRLKVILQRSGNVDLWISLCGHSAMEYWEEPLSLLSTLVAHAERWRYLKLSWSMTHQTLMAMEKVKGHLPRLSQLHLNILDADGTPLDMFSIAPRLEKVAIDMDHYQSRVIVPLHQLTSYVRTKGYEEYSLAAFSRLTHLEICWKHSGDPLEPRITLPHLEFLGVEFSSSDTAEGPREFFGRLVLPSIKEIHVDGSPARGNPSLVALSSMISRSLPCDLHTLSITDTYPAPSGELTTLLHLIPQLKSLEIPIPPQEDLSSLFPTPETPVLVPNLQSLHITVLPYFGFDRSSSDSLAIFVAMREMLENAGTGFLSRLRSLELRFRSEDDCCDVYSALQPPPAPPVGDSLDDEVLALLNSWKVRLMDAIPSLTRPQTLRIERNSVKTSPWHRLKDLFNEMEGYDIPTSGYLHASKLHLSMYEVIRLDPRLIPGNSSYDFSGRARALLVRWAPILLQDVDHYKWLNKHPTTLYYVPKGAEFRRSSSAINLIYCAVSIRSPPIARRYHFAFPSLGSSSLSR